MSDGTAVEAAIRAWQAARATSSVAREAVFEARAVLLASARALGDAEAREDEARSAAIPLMVRGDDGPVGWIVHGRMYYLDEILDEIRSIRIANPVPESTTPTEPAVDDGHVWNPCHLKCPRCNHAGLVRYRPMQYDYRLRCDKCGHAWRSGTVDERGGGA